MGAPLAERLYYEEAILVIYSPELRIKLQNYASPPRQSHQPQKKII